MRFKVGDLVRNTHEQTLLSLHSPKHGEDIGIVLEIVKSELGGYQQLKIGTPSGITLWWPSVTEVISESR